MRWFSCGMKALFTILLLHLGYVSYHNTVWTYSTVETLNLYTSLSSAPCVSDSYCYMLPLFVFWQEKKKNLSLHQRVQLPSDYFICWSSFLHIFLCCLRWWPSWTSVSINILPSLPFLCWAWWCVFCCSLSWCILIVFRAQCTVLPKSGSHITGSIIWWCYIHITHREIS